MMVAIVMISLVVILMVVISVLEKKIDQGYYHNLRRGMVAKYDGTDIDQVITDEWLEKNPDYLKIK